MITALGLFLVPLSAGGYLLIRRGKSYSTIHRLVLAGLLATLAARFLEQMAGVASISDLAITWVLLGVFAALPVVMGEAPAIDPPHHPSSTRHERRRTERVDMLTNLGWMWRPALAVILILGVGTLTYIKTIEPPLAAVKAREGIEQIQIGDLPNAQASLEQAVSLAPGVVVYSGLLASVYDAYGADASLDREAECGVTSDERAYQICLARKVLLHHRRAAEQRPMDWRPQLAVAESTLALASLEQSSQLAEDAVTRFRRVAQMDPQAWWRWEALAVAYNQTGQPQQALEALETSFTLLGDSDEAAYSLLLQGVAWRNLDQPSNALDALDWAIILFHSLKDSPRDPSIGYLFTVNKALADAYSNRGAVLIDADQNRKAIADLDQAVALNPDLAAAFNNRANAYANMDLFQIALGDYQEALRLDPRLALAYYNRALAYTYLGKDQSARLDLEMAMDLGMDTTALVERIERIKKDR